MKMNCPMGMDTLAEWATLLLLAAALFPAARRDFRSQEILQRDRLLLLIPTCLFWLQDPARIPAGCQAAAGILLVGGGLYRASGGRLLGGGDIKLLAVSGLFLGGEGVLRAALGAFLSALAVQYVRGGDLRSRVALGPFLALGIWFSACLLKK